MIDSRSSNPLANNYLRSNSKEINRGREWRVHLNGSEQRTPRAVGAAKRERNDRAPYLTWARQGHLELTDGEVTDYAFILDRISQLREKFDLREVAFDRFGATSIVTALQEAGLEVAQFGQGFLSMSPACKEVERLVVSQKLLHPKNPVLTWCAANTVVQIDPAGNLKPSRNKSTEKIDGMVALAMAVGRWMAQPAEVEFDFRIV